MIRSLLALALLGTVACVEDLGEGRTAAVVDDVATVHAATPVPAGTVTLPIDHARSKIDALGAKVTAKHPIHFSDFSGDVQLAGADVAGLEFTVQVASLSTDNGHLTDHLKKEDFLWVDRYPTATFASTSVTAGSPEPGMTHEVTGDLTIRGVTRRVTFPAKIAVSGSDVSATSEFTVNRQDFGVTYPGKADDLVQDTVVLTISFVAPRTEAS